MNRAETIAAIEALDALARRRREFPPAHYRPASPKHAAAHAAAARRLVLRGGNKSGKSVFGWAHALAHSVGYWYWLVPDLKLDPVTGWLPARPQIPVEYWIRLHTGGFLPWPNTGNIVTGLAKDEGIAQTIWPIAESFFPPAVHRNPEFQIKKDNKGIVSSLHLPGGSHIYFFSGHQDDLSFEATRIQWAWLDEPVKPFIYNGLWRGLAMDRGPIWFTLTPLGNKASWLYTDIIRSGSPDVAEFKLGCADNPYFSEEARREFENNNTWTEAERRARLFGEFEGLGNRVIHTWNPAIHVIPSHPIPASWVRGQTVDPHHVRPAAVGWWAISPWGVYHFYREWPNGEFVKMRSGGKSPKEYARLFREIEEADVPHIRSCDPRFAAGEYTTHGSTQTAWTQQMAEQGLIYETRLRNIKTVEAGEQIVIDMLRHNTEYPISPTNTPKILVHDCCTNIITALDNYGIMLSKDPSKTSEKASEEYKDFVDVVRYGVLTPVPGHGVITPPNPHFDPAWDSAQEALIRENEPI